MDVDDILNTVINVTRAAEHELAQAYVSPTRRQHVIRDLTSCIRVLHETSTRVSEGSSRQPSRLEELANTLMDIKSAVITKSSSRTAPPASIPVDVLREGKAGRPRLDIPDETLRHLDRLGYDQTEMACMLDVNRKTIQRRCKLFGIVLHPTVSDVDLQAALLEVRQRMPSSGIIMVHTELKRAGVRVSQKRVGLALRILEPEAVAGRWARTIRRRVYRVKGPMSLWHIDGHARVLLCFV